MTEYCYEHHGTPGNADESDDEVTVIRVDADDPKEAWHMLAAVIREYFPKTVLDDWTLTTP